MLSLLPTHLQRLPCDPDLGLLSQISALYPLAIDPLLDLIDRQERAADVPTVAQDKSRRRYRTTPDAAEMRQFLAAGHRFWAAQGYDAMLARFIPSGKTMASQTDGSDSHRRGRLADAWSE